MITRNIFFQYIKWQFLDMPKGILQGWGNCLRFNLNYWSVPLLLRTFFSHWRRYQYSYGRGLDLKRYFETFIFNMVSRILGAIMRSVLIVSGLFAETLVFFAGAVVLLIWLILPFILLGGFLYGFKILF